MADANNQPTYKAALIGAGRIGMLHEGDPKRLKPATHFGMWAAHPRFDFVAVCDNMPEKFDFARERVPDIACYDDAEKMLVECEPDAVSIATWRDSHYDMMKLCLRHGVKAIVCEKPIAEKKEHAEEVVAECRERGAHLMVNHRRRFDPLLYPLRDEIRGGMIGEIQQVSSHYVFGLVTTGTHLIDTLRMFLKDVAGEIVWVSAFPNRLHAHAPADDPCIDGVLGFENGLKATVQSMNIQDFDIFNFEFFGRKGRVRIHNIGRDVDIYRVIESPEHAGFTELETEPGERRGGAPRDQFGFLADNVAGCLDGTAQSLSSGEDSLKALEILLAMQRSAADGGRVTEVA